MTKREIPDVAATSILPPIVTTVGGVLIAKLYEAGTILSFRSAQQKAIEEELATGTVSEPTAELYLNLKEKVPGSTTLADHVDPLFDSTKSPVNFSINFLQILGIINLTRGEMHRSVIKNKAPRKILTALKTLATLSAPAVIDSLASASSLESGGEPVATWLGYGLLAFAALSQLDALRWNLSPLPRHPESQSSYEEDSMVTDDHNKQSTTNRWTPKRKKSLQPIVHRLDDNGEIEGTITSWLKKYAINNNGRSPDIIVKQYLQTHLNRIDELNKQILAFDNMSPALKVRSESKLQALIDERDTLATRVTDLVCGRADGQNWQTGEYEYGPNVGEA